MQCTQVPRFLNVLLIRVLCFQLTAGVVISSCNCEGKKTGGTKKSVQYYLSTFDTVDNQDHTYESYLFYAAAVCSRASADLHRRAIKVPKRAIKRNKVASI